MNTSLIVLLLSILVFVGGALFINFSVKHEDNAKQKAANETAKAHHSNSN